MPALKMKTTANLICSREGTGLGVCQKSSKISKTSSSQVRIYLQADDLESSTQSNEDLSSNIESSSSENECDEALDPDIFDGEIYHCRSSPLSGFNPSDIVEFLPDEHDYGTIFSPVFESVEYHDEWGFHNHAEVANTQTDVVQSKDDDDNGSSSSCDYETDFCLSNTAASGFSFDRTEELNEAVEVDPFPNQDCLDRNMIVDVAGRYMMLPLGEMEGVTTYDFDPCELATMNTYDACLYLAIQQMSYYNPESDVNSHSFGLDDIEGSDSQIYMRNVSDLSDMVPASCLTFVPKRKLVTLVLDLDETLVHSTLDNCIDADFTFPVEFNMKEHTVYVRRRPHLQTFLERVAEMFEIVIFTASLSTYAEKLLDILDPEDKFISKRAYRESCILSDGMYTKDLTVLGVDLAKAAIVDNSPQVFQLQVNNGIPIKSWFDDPSDSALLSLLPFLETLVDADDVRPLIEKKFSNKE